MSIDDQIISVLQQLMLTREKWEHSIANGIPALPAWPGNNAQSINPAPYIDHTLLKPEATESQIDKLCSEAIEHNFASVCVNSCHIAQCASVLAGQSVIVCGVVGFPLGAMATPAKICETRSIIKDGAKEVDMVINIGKLKSGNLGYVFDDIHAVCHAADNLPVKVILETCLLTEDEIVSACTIAVLAGASFVKTSTGFSSGIALAAHVSLMRNIVGPHIGVKASGGIRDYDTAATMIRAGANRLGTSSGVAIVNQTGKPAVTPDFY